MSAPSGISCCGDLEWGAHFCHLYETREDLIDTLVPFFAAGLANNEQCSWVTAAPLDAADARAAMEARVPGFRDYAERGQIQIVDHSEMYTRDGRFDADALLGGWVRAEQDALDRGFTGLRVTGNVTFLQSREEWCQFERYEARVTETFAGRRLVALCSYHLGTTAGRDVLDVVRNHQFALARRHGTWELIENAELKTAKRHLHDANVDLERRVGERTAELRDALAAVEAHRLELEEALRTRDESRRQLEAELADARLLHEISAALVEEDDGSALFQRLVDAASVVMRSRYASLQRFHPERGDDGELELLAHRGFSAEAASFWAWVRMDSESTCGRALRTRERVIAVDVATCDFMAGSPDLATYLGTGIRAVQTTPLLSRAGTLVGMISTHWERPHRPSERDLRLVDILARQAADAIERSAATEALRAQAAQLVEADRRKDEFLATLAHELRNPLAPLRTGLDVLKTGKLDAAPRVLGIMERQLANMVHLIDDLLDVSRVSQGKVTLRREHVNLRTAIDSAIETSRPLLEAGKHQFTLTMPGHALWLDADATRIAQVVSNIINNAAKYTPEGGTIALVIDQSGGEVAIRVSDDGIGIPPAMLPKVFDLFAQIGQSLDRSQGGLGIGLSLARRLVEMHGGTISAESDGLGRGCTFTVRLPLAAPPTVALPSADGSDIERGGRRILIVDDNLDAAFTLAMLLESCGHQTAVCNESAGTLSAARELRPDVVFLDIGMPAPNGYDVARQLRLAPELADIMLVALTGWGTEEDRERSRQAGFDHHLTKPVFTNDLNRVLGRVAGGADGKARRLD